VQIPWHNFDSVIPTYAQARLRIVTRNLLNRKVEPSSKEIHTGWGMLIVKAQFYHSFQELQMEMSSCYFRDINNNTCAWKHITIFKIPA